jgi:hypothetical protein
MKWNLKGTIMRRTYCFLATAILCAVLSTANSSLFAATIVLSDDFSGADGNLVGTTPDVSAGNWSQTGATATNPIQVSGNKVALGTTGQDAYAAFSTAAPNTPDTQVHTSMDINISAVQAAGDYFTHLSDPVGTTSIFVQRVGAIATSGGYFLTLAATAGGGATTAIGTTVLNLNQTYHLDLYWNFLAGSDTIDLHVDGSATPYLSKSWDSSNAEPPFLSAGNFRQGTASNAATLTVDNYQVEVIPEPTTAVLAGIMGLFCLSCRRKAS